jgi:hypothetical protein
MALSYSRRKIDTVRKQFGWQSKQMDSLWRKINYQDSINLIRVRKILDIYGWLGADVLGQQGNTTLFSVIQHYDIIYAHPGYIFSENAAILKYPELALLAW